MRIRQPIVSVLGHVDHGNTTLLDRIRGTTVVQREAGRITQHIGATEVPASAIYDLCGGLLKDKSLKVPGLLFIDTPGHEAFTTLRARGGSLADLAVLVVDIYEGLKPQSIESLNYLKQFKTPFVVAANKIDRLSGWVRDENVPFTVNFKKQTERYQKELEEKLYDLIGALGEQGFSAERFDRVADFTNTLAIVPMSAKWGVGLQELLMLLIGLSQRFLEKSLEVEEGEAKGTVLEVKEEKGLGKTLDVIVYDGVLKIGDIIVVGTTSEPVVTKVKSLLKPKPLDEIRDPQHRFDQINEVVAAAGVKVLAKDIEGVIAGAPLRGVSDEKRVEGVLEEVRRLSTLSIELDREGVYIKADTLGSLEALSKMLKDRGIKIARAEIGDISERDIKELSAIEDPFHRVILAFNVNALPGAEELSEETGVIIIRNNVIYRIVEDYEKWVEETRRRLEEERRQQYAHPAEIKVLEGYVFRISHPAIVGVKVLSGRVRVGHALLRGDGKRVGVIKSIQSEKKSIKEASLGMEVAVAIEGATVGRQFKEGDILYVDIPEGRVRELLKADLTPEERETLTKVIEIHRRKKPTWGMI